MIQCSVLQLYKRNELRGTVDQGSIQRVFERDIDIRFAHLLNAAYGVRGGDFVLLVRQLDPRENGRYLVYDDRWERCDPMERMHGCTFVNGSTRYICTNVTSNDHGNGQSALFFASF